MRRISELNNDVKKYKIKIRIQRIDNDVINDCIRSLGIHYLGS